MCRRVVRGEGQLSTDGDGGGSRRDAARWMSEMNGD